MSDSAYVFDATLETFQERVLQASLHVPVLVDFWADWCAPCKALMPVLTKLADEYQGGFLLAKVNGDQEPEVSQHFGVRSLPTVKILFKGKVVDEFTGALPESRIRAILEKHVVKPAVRLLQQARELMAVGQTAQAEAVLQEANRREPANVDVLVELAMMKAAAGDEESARQVLDALPLEERGKASVRQLTARLKFVGLVKSLPSVEVLESQLANAPTNPELLHPLALHRVAASRVEEAMALLMTLIQTDRTWRDDLGRTTLIELFDLLGSDDPVVKSYRRRLYTLMH